MLDSHSAVKRAERNVRLSQDQKQLDNATMSLDTVVATLKKLMIRHEKVSDEHSGGMKTAERSHQEELKNSARS